MMNSLKLSIYKQYHQWPLSLPLVTLWMELRYNLVISALYVFVHSVSLRIPDMNVLWVTGFVLHWHHYQVHSDTEWFLSAHVTSLSLSLLHIDSDSKSKMIINRPPRRSWIGPLKLIWAHHTLYPLESVRSPSNWTERKSIVKATSCLVFCR